MLDSDDAACYNIFTTQRVIRFRNPNGGSGMELVKKIFLFSVGVITIAFDEASAAVEQTLEMVKEQREKMNGYYTKQKA